MIISSFLLGHPVVPDGLLEVLEFISEPVSKIYTQEKGDEIGHGVLPVKVVSSRTGP
jgi:hypothetical protein